MNNLNATIQPNASTNNILKAILAELHLLRDEMSLEDDLEDYAHSEKIKQSYNQALKDYPIEL